MLPSTESVDGRTNLSESLLLGVAVQIVMSVLIRDISD